MKKTTFLLVALLAGACSNSVPSDASDAGQDRPDAASADAGAPPVDAGGEDDGGPPPPPPDAGPPLPMVACDMLPGTVPSGDTDDVYYQAADVCGLPGGECVVRQSASLDCAGGAHVLVGYDFTDAGQVRVQNDWTIASATAGVALDPQRQVSIPLDEEASVILEAPDGARYALTFVVGFDSVRVVSFAAAAP